VAVSPTASPPRRANQRAMVDSIGMEQQLLAIDRIMPQIRNTCQSELTWESSRSPMPPSMPLVAASNRGPCLSLSLPVIMESIAAISIYIARAAEKAPRSQPNSMVIGLKNMPKL